MESLSFNPAVSCGFAPRKTPEQGRMLLPHDIIMRRREERALVQEEIRFQELLKKEKAGELNEEEKRELEAAKIFRFAEVVASVPKVCYMA